MHTSSGLLIYLGQRLGTVGLTLLVLLAVALVVAMGLAVAVVVAGDPFAAGADPVQVAPFRWVRRG